jgi:hypothetical protein
LLVFSWTVLLTHVRIITWILWKKNWFSWSGSRVAKMILSNVHFYFWSQKNLVPERNIGRNQLMWYRADTSIKQQRNICWNLITQGCSSGSAFSNNARVGSANRRWK